MPSSSPTSAAEQALIRWLDATSAAAGADALAELRRRLADEGLAGTDGPELRVRVGAAAAAQVARMCERFCAEADGLGLPLSVALFERQDGLARLVVEVADALADGVERASGAQDDKGDKGDKGELALRGLALLADAFKVCGLAATEPPRGFWRVAHRLVRSAGLGKDAPTTQAYLRLLTVAVSQPEGLSGSELVWLFDFLDERLLAAAGFAPGGPAVTDAPWWIDLGSDAGPNAVARRALPAEHVRSADVWSFNPRQMAQRLGECVDWVTANLTAAELAGTQCDVAPLASEEAGFPSGLAPLEILALLKRLRALWMNVPVREQPRRAQRYVVEVCTGLNAVWQLGRGGGDRRTLPLQEWAVLNESPGGLAIMRVTGVEGEVEAGSMLVLRRSADQPWSVCVVRWVRSEHPGQIELGLQIIGIGFQSVEVGFRGRGVQSLTPALALPVMEPVRRHPAMLAPAGTYASRRFVFVRDGASVYVAQARALGLDMQTARVELFQYEHDPYPI